MASRGSDADNVPWLLWCLHRGGVCTGLTQQRAVRPHPLVHPAVSGASWDTDPGVGALEGMVLHLLTFLRETSVVSGTHSDAESETQNRRGLPCAHPLQGTGWRGCCAWSEHSDAGAWAVAPQVRKQWLLQVGRCPGQAVLCTVIHFGLAQYAVVFQFKEMRCWCSGLGELWYGL